MSINKRPTKFDIELKLGEETVKLRKWKAKDLGTFQETLENAHDIDSLTIEQLQKLVTPCIENYEGKYYSHYDLLNMLFAIRRETLGNEVKFHYLCEGCQHEMDIDIDLTETAKYDEDTFSDITIGNLVFHINRDIKHSVLLQKQEDDKYTNENPVLIELLLRISSFEEDGVTNDAYTFDELYEFIDDMDLTPYTKLLEEYINQMSYFECSGEYTCEECGHTHGFEFDIIPSFFGTL